MSQSGTFPSCSVGEVLCLLGENGAGKSTVITMPTGVEQPTSGQIPVDMEAAERTALKSLRDLAIGRVTNGRQLVGTLSGGERQAPAIGRAIHFGARVPVLDEPTAALGVRESAVVPRLIRKVRRNGVAVVFITHNAYHAEATGDRFVVLGRGECLASFSKGEKTVEEIIELMAGGAELKSLLTEEPEAE